jgi:hypothetical protein
MRACKQRQGQTYKGGEECRPLELNIIMTELESSEHHCGCQEVIAFLGRHSHNRKRRHSGKKQRVSASTKKLEVREEDQYASHMIGRKFIINNYISLTSLVQGPELVKR